MLPDGTNPDHFPGEPFVRRMWAGGKVTWNNDRPLRLDGGVGVCAEFIRDVSTKGEKVFVEIERRIAKASKEEIEGLGEAWQNQDVKRDLEHRVRQRLWRNEGEDFGPASILERRTLVFMRSRTPEEATTEAAKSASKMLKPEHDTPDYTHLLTPDPKLLFRFSALTFNAHAIHLDPLYSRDVEGHKNILVHGPLSLTFIITLLSQHLAKEGNQVIRSIEYRNTAPLYCGEQAKFCGKRTDEKKWEVWAENPQGGIAVKGRVKTEEGRIDKSDLGV
ncbi:Mesaconyl-C(4)-CoA hydratase [Pseudocercospora fuligena]|uniref:Mesaconyl-C(4)-CoA hydratase n=1 Tax=Pseudocercospora fuligena TaxID=685502 RepID=A0A8H6R9A7_9PEZI|nr:Mesaconyl-C(4)-CoA hydratase [Pseudocercospora fuligena]